MSKIDYFEWRLPSDRAMPELYRRNMMEVTLEHLKKAMESSPIEGVYGMAKCLGHWGLTLLEPIGRED